MFVNISTRSVRYSYERYTDDTIYWRPGNLRDSDLHKLVVITYEL